MKKSKLPKLFLQIFGMTYFIIFVLMLTNNGIHDWGQSIYILELALIVDFFIYIPIWGYRILKAGAEEREKKLTAYDTIIKQAKENKEGLPTITNNDEVVKYNLTDPDPLKITSNNSKIVADQAKNLVKAFIEQTGLPAEKCELLIKYTTNGQTIRVLAKDKYYIPPEDAIFEDIKYHVSNYFVLSDFHPDYICEKIEIIEKVTNTKDNALFLFGMLSPNGQNKILPNLKSETIEFLKDRIPGYFADYL